VEVSASFHFEEGVLPRSAHRAQKRGPRLSGREPDPPLLRLQRVEERAEAGRLPEGPPAAALQVLVGRCGSHGVQGSALGRHLCGIWHRLPGPRSRLSEAQVPRYQQVRRRVRTMH